MPKNILTVVGITILFLGLAIQPSIATVQPEEHIRVEPNVKDIHLILEILRFNNQVMQKGLTAVIKEDKKLNRIAEEIKSLDCGCDDISSTRLWSFPVICLLLFPLWFISFSFYWRLGILEFYNFMRYIGYKLNCPWY